MANHYARQAPARPVPICPKCGKQSREARTRYGLRNSCCGLWSWDRHELVDADTHRARNEAHTAFDRLWKSRLMTRGDAYKALAAEMGLTSEQCHMKLMDRETAIMVPIAVSAIVDRLRANA